jgi:L-amino acid N-acyltransferase YncA
VEYERQGKMLEYVEATETDLDRMLGLYNHYIENTSVLFDDRPISLEEFSTRVYIKHDMYKTFLILQDNEFYGFCFLTRFRKKRAYDKTAEVGIYLRPDFTRKGLGQEIVTYLEAMARKQGFEVMIASICGENTASLSLFRKLGYEQCAHYKQVAEKFGRKMDLVDFQKILRASGLPLSNK